MSAHGKFVPDPSWPSIVDLAIELWGQPNKAMSRPDDVRFGDKGSKIVKPSALVWKDHESGEGGGYVEMWRLARRGAPLPARERAMATEAGCRRGRTSASSTTITTPTAT